MNINPVRSDDDLRAVFKQLEWLFQAQEGTPEAGEMEILRIGNSNTLFLARDRPCTAGRLHEETVVQCAMKPSNFSR